MCVTQHLWWENNTPRRWIFFSLHFLHKYWWRFLIVSMASIQRLISLVCLLSLCIPRSSYDLFEYRTGVFCLLFHFFFLLVITYKFDVAFNAFHGIKIFGKLYVIWWKKHWIVSISMVLCIQSTFMLNFHQKRIENEHTWWQKDNNTWCILLNWIAVQLNRVKSRCALKFILIGSGWIAC